MKADDGCDGGEESDAFDYAKKHAILPEADYKYIGKTERCRVKENEGVVKVSGYHRVPEKSVS